MGVFCDAHISCYLIVFNWEVFYYHSAYEIWFDNYKRGGVAFGGNGLMRGGYYICKVECIFI